MRIRRSLSLPAAAFLVALPVLQARADDAAKLPGRWQIDNGATLTLHADGTAEGDISSNDPGGKATLGSLGIQMKWTGIWKREGDVLTLQATDMGPNVSAPNKLRIEKLTEGEMALTQLSDGKKSIAKRLGDAEK